MTMTPWLAAAFLALPAQPKPVAVMVLPIEAKGGVAPDVAELATAVMVGEMRKVRGIRVGTLKEVEGAMSHEQRRQVSGCNSVSCAAEIALALNSEQIVFGTLGKVGKNNFVLNLSRVGADNAKVLGSSVRRITGTDEALILDHLPSMVTEMFPDLIGPNAVPESRAAPAKPERIATAVTTAPSTEPTPAAPAAAPSSPPPPAQPASTPAAEEPKGPNVLALALMGAGGVGLGVAVVGILVGIVAAGASAGLFGLMTTPANPFRGMGLGLPLFVAMLAGLGVGGLSIPITLIVAAAGAGSLGAGVLLR